MADNAPDVEEEITSMDSSPEGNDAEESAGSSTSSDETVKQDTTLSAKTTERIRDLIEQRNNSASELAAIKGTLTTYQPTPQYDGVTPDGIDPEKFAQSLRQDLARQNQALTQNQVQFQIAIMEVRKDPVMKSKVAQEHVSSLINQGIRPEEALEIYKDDLKTIEAELLAKNKTRKSATDATREGTSISSTGRSSAPSGTFTWSQIESMPIAEYKANQTEIKRQAQAGLIK